MFKSKWVLAAFGLCLILPMAGAAQTPAGGPTAVLRWRSVGPYTGGRITTVAGIASKPNEFFMGTAGGGVWETTNYGHSWKNISDKYFKTGNIGAMAIAPSNPQIIYVGTGDNAPRNTEVTGEGMYKSTDGGKSWSFIGLGATHIISWIVVDPRNPDVVYAAAFGHLWGPNPERGVYKTTDGGKTWTKVLFVNDGTGAITLAMDPSNPQVVYAAMWEMSRQHWGFSSGGPGSGIFKTTDGGAHWTNITHNPGLPTGIFGKVGLAVAPSQPNVVYALVQATYKGQAGGLFRSDNGGKTWRMETLSQNITQRDFYYGYVYVDPKDANTLYLPNVGVYVSHDAGKTLIALHPPHGDNHVFWVNPKNPKILIEGNDGGATVSLDGGQSWSSEDNQPTGQFYHANLDEQFPFHIYGAQQDRSSYEGSSAAPKGVWTTVRGGEMSWVVPEPGKPWITFASGYYSDEYRGNRRTGESALVSAWPEYKFGAGGKDIKYRFGWNHHAALFDPHNPDAFLMGANVVLETRDQGVHWKAISPDLTRDDKTKQLRPGGPIAKDVTGEEMFDTISSIAFSPLDANVIWTGSDDGLVYVTTNRGGHWTPVRPPALPKWSTITCIEPSHTDAGTAWVSASRFDWDDFHPYVYRTTDYGKTWTALTSGLAPDEYVESVRQDPDDPGLMFVATSRTVYDSQDGGQHWQPLTLNLPAVRVNDIEIDSRAARRRPGDVRAGVLGPRRPAVSRAGGVGSVGSCGERQGLRVQAAAGLADLGRRSRVRRWRGAGRASGSRRDGVLSSAVELRRPYAGEAGLHDHGRRPDQQLHAAAEAAAGPGRRDGQGREAPSGHEPLPVEHALPDRGGGEGDLPLRAAERRARRAGSRARHLRRQADLRRRHPGAAVRGEAGPEAARHAGAAAGTLRSAEADPDGRQRSGCEPEPGD